MPKFILLICDDESASPHPGEPGFQELWDAYVELDNQARAAGALIDSQPFGPTAEAVTLTVRSGRSLVTPGPAARTESQLTGYYLLQCKDQAEAIAWAAKIPAAATGSVEVRAIFEGPDIT
jgi:hypothetical protein